MAWKSKIQVINNLFRLNKGKRVRMANNLQRVSIWKLKCHFPLLES